MSDMSGGNAVEIRGLTKAFGPLLAVDDVSFSVRAGEVFGFMGHNGAGNDNHPDPARSPGAHGRWRHRARP